MPQEHEVVGATPTEGTKFRTAGSRLLSAVIRGRLHGAMAARLTKSGNVGSNPAGHDILTPITQR